LSLKRVRETARIIIGISKEQLDLAAMAIATLVDRYDWAVGSMKDVVRIFNGVRNVLGRPFDLAFNSLSGGFDLGQFDNLPYACLYVSGDLNFQTLSDVPPIDPILVDFRGEIEKVKEATREIAAQATDEIREKVAALVVKIGEAFDGILEDYDPLKLSFDSDFGDITNLFDVRNQQFRTRFEATVNSLKVTRNRLPEADTQLPPASLGEWEEVRDGVEDAALTLLDFRVPTIPAFILRFFMWLSMFHGVYDFSFRVGYLSNGSFGSLMSRKCQKSLSGHQGLTATKTRQNRKSSRNRPQKRSLTLSSTRRGCFLSCWSSESFASLT
jgi:hypothetical protein